MNQKIFTGFLLVVLIAGVGFLLMPKNTSAPEHPSSQQQNQAEPTQVSSGNGEKLAGDASPYVAFSQAAYEKAVADGKVVFLDFYADWCPICRAEAPEIQAGFASLNTDRVIGFRVNFNDENTDEDEKKLAKQFNVPYQHTKIVLKNGKEVLRSGDQWDKETFLKEINKFL